MPLDLPEPISIYFAADASDNEAFARCFSDHAVVKDEGHTYTGLAAIKQWKSGTSSKYTYTSKPYACADVGGKPVVTSRLTGNFPGSPIDLRYVFGLEGDKISFLEITL